MKCPICNKQSKVFDVRHPKNESKRRSRICENGHTFRSYELSEERFQELLDYEKYYFKVQELSRTYDS
ncbi:hypothetical protein NSQ59_07365 [Margalitia sp. FSL K6-0131]|uniref:NrdR family transcriptional regulator n=1 Tax=Margalitia sp. FSL K6-0131 TaxID=2954604 RepID=UPI0030F70318